MFRNRVFNSFKHRWAFFWIERAGLSPMGRLAYRLAGCFLPPYKGRTYLAQRSPRGYVAPNAVIHHPQLQLGAHVFIGERVVIYQQCEGGAVTIGERVQIHNDTIIEVGPGGSVSIGANSAIQARCQLAAYQAAIQIGSNVQIAPNCAFYPYDHGLAADQPINEQPLHSRGDIVVGDGAWLGYGVVLLSGVRIGAGAVLGAGAVVTQDIPAGAIAVGAPARVIRMRKELALEYGATPLGIR